VRYDSRYCGPDLSSEVLFIKLPITEFLPDILTRLSTGCNVVLQAEPGAGKSTALPLSLLDAPWLRGKKIIMLEPRRVAAKSIAHYLASQLGEKVGHRIGYQIKNDRKISQATVLEIVTEGILTRRLQGDPELPDVALIIFDEFHLRSLQADISLLLCLEIQQSIREDLKMLVMSATIDTAMVSHYLQGAPVIECPGRNYPVAVTYSSPGSELLVKQVVGALRGVINGCSSGDVLIFLPGRAEINKSIAAVKASLGGAELLLLPLYGALTLSQQERALVPDPDGRRRVIFSTNIAETSLTIEGVTCVIDSGLEKELIYDPVSGLTRLETTYISKASAAQRSGRAGRTQAGECVRLWAEEKHGALKEFQTEEMLSADLTGVLLELALWGGGGYENTNWLTPPPRAHYQSANSTLIALGMINGEDKITALGRDAAAIGLSPRLAAMVLQARGEIEQGIACELAALLSDRDIFSANRGVDIVERLLAVQDYKKNRQSALGAYPFKRAAVEQLLTNAGAYRRVLRCEKACSPFSLAQLQHSTGILLLYAFPDRLAKRRSSADNRYQLANGRGVFLYPDDPLFGCDFLVVADCDGQKKEGRIYTAGAISLASIWACLDEKITVSTSFDFDVGKQKITGRKLTQYGAIILKQRAVSEVPADVFQNLLQQAFKRCGLQLLNWTPSCDNLLARIQWLGGYIDTFPKISKTSLIDNIDSWLLPYLSAVHTIASLKKLNTCELLLGTLSWSEQQLLNREAPIEYITPSNKKVPVVYDLQQGPRVSVPLQEMFGQIDSPMIAGGQYPIKFELLSPARRPIQTTSDLGNFWRTSYFDVAKEMRGRYPKHRWPDQPLLERPGKSLKRR